MLHNKCKDGYDDLKPQLMLAPNYLPGLAFESNRPGGRLPNGDREVLRPNTVDAQVEVELLGGFSIWLEDWLRLHECDWDFIPAPTLFCRPTWPSNNKT